MLSGVEVSRSWRKILGLLWTSSTSSKGVSGAECARQDWSVTCPWSGWSQFSAGVPARETLPDSRLYYIIIFPPLCFTLCLISGGISLSSVCLLTYALMLLGSPVNRSFSHPLWNAGMSEPFFPVLRIGSEPLFIPLRPQTLLTPPETSPSFHRWLLIGVLLSSKSKFNNGVVFYISVNEAWCIDLLIRWSLSACLIVLQIRPIHFPHNISDIHELHSKKPVRRYAAESLSFLRKSIWLMILSLNSKAMFTTTIIFFSAPYIAENLRRTERSEHAFDDSITCNATLV